MTNRFTFFAAICLATVAAIANSWALPSGYVLHTIPLDAPPVGLAFDNSGTLFALEEAGFGNNVATLRSILPDGTFGDSWSVVGDDENNLFTGSLTYDHVSDRLLITDNTADGRIYAVNKSGVQTTIASSIASISGITVRSTGEIFVSTSLGAGIGGVYQVDRTTGSTTSVMPGLDFGSGVSFDDAGNLLVMDAAAEAPFLGRLYQLPITDGEEGLVFGTPELLIDGLSGSAGLVWESDDRFFTTGIGGIYEVTGQPLTEDIFFHNGNSSQFATALALQPGSSAFAPFAGPEGSRLAVMADYGFTSQDSFITLFTAAVPEDFNSDGVVDGADLAVWEANFGTLAGADPSVGDATQDGTVDGADFLRWQRAFNSPPTVASIPEPSAILLGLVVSPSFFATRLVRRRRVV